MKLSDSAGQGQPQDTQLLTFRVEDTGCGIREEDLERIFDNFRQVDSKRNRTVEGTGLGLSITKRLVGLMQGTITVESVYGEGTVFTVKIPQKVVDSRPLSEHPEVEVRKEEKLEPFLVEDCKVLVVDDNAVNRKIARIFLQSYGLEITEADSGADHPQRVRGKWEAACDHSIVSECHGGRRGDFFEKRFSGFCRKAAGQETAA